MQALVSANSFEQSHLLFIAKINYNLQLSRLQVVNRNAHKKEKYLIFQHSRASVGISVCECVIECLYLRPSLSLTISLIKVTQ